MLPGPSSYTIVPSPTVDPSYDDNLGKLTDGIIAIESPEPRTRESNTSTLDPVWVQWEPSTSGKVEIRYDYDQIQNFTSLNINLMTDKAGISGLKEVFVTFSMDSSYWHRTPVYYVENPGSSKSSKNFVKGKNFY